MPATDRASVYISASDLSKKTIEEFKKNLETVEKTVNIVQNSFLAFNIVLGGFQTLLGHFKFLLASEVIPALWNLLTPSEAAAEAILKLDKATGQLSQGIDIHLVRASELLIESNEKLKASFLEIPEAATRAFLDETLPQFARFKAALSEEFVGIAKTLAIYAEAVTRAGYNTLQDFVNPVTKGINTLNQYNAAIYEVIIGEKGFSEALSDASKDTSSFNAALDEVSDEAFYKLDPAIEEATKSIVDLSAALRQAGEEAAQLESIELRAITDRLQREADLEVRNIERKRNLAEQERQTLSKLNELALEGRLEQLESYYKRGFSSEALYQLQKQSLIKDALDSEIKDLKDQIKEKENLAQKDSEAGIQAAKDLSDLRIALAEKTLEREKLAYSELEKTGKATYAALSVAAELSAKEAQESFEDFVQKTNDSFQKLVESRVKILGTSTTTGGFTLPEGFSLTSTVLPNLVGSTVIPGAEQRAILSGPGGQQFTGFFNLAPGERALSSEELFQKFISESPAARQLANSIKINVTNTGTPVNVVSAAPTEKEGETTIDIILEDLSKNGEFSQSLDSRIRRIARG
jgi:hypothetical protein